MKRSKHRELEKELDIAIAELTRVHVLVGLGELTTDSVEMSVAERSLGDCLRTLFKYLALLNLEHIIEQQDELQRDLSVRDRQVRTALDEQHEAIRNAVQLDLVLVEKTKLCDTLRAEVERLKQVNEELIKQRDDAVYAARWKIL